MEEIKDEAKTQGLSMSAFIRGLFKMFQAAKAENLEAKNRKR